MTEFVPLLPGEELVYHCSCFATVPSNSSPGTVHLTTYKLCFVAEADDCLHSKLSFPLPTACLQAPLGVVAKVEAECRGDKAALEIECKDFRSIRLEFESKKALDAFHAQLVSMAFPKLPADMFAFKYSPSQAGEDGWNTFDPAREYERLEIASHWRVSHLNTDQRVCSSYPPSLIVPSAMTDAELEAAARFRRRQRFPVLCWSNKGNNSVLLRSAQPNVGVFRRWCLEDEAILRTAVDAMGDGRGVHVFDCRSQSRAVLHTVFGGGRELYRGTHYGIAAYHNLEIENAEGQQEMLLELKAALKQLDTKTLRNLRVMSALCGSRWCRQLLRILTGAARVAAVLHAPARGGAGGSVLVHCNDGWNRTPQVVSVAQLLLDPFYRTLHGFAVLVEKEWVGSGHRFASRLAHRGRAGGGEAPIFVQFLECVWQLLQARPSAFEFTEALLVALADAAWACRHGTFLFDSPAHAAAADARNKTVSVWADLERRRPALLNPRFKPYAGLLRVHFNVEDLQVWGGLHLRYLHQDWTTPLPPDPLCPETAFEDGSEGRSSDVSLHNGPQVA